jgi:acyl-CoA hydrolase/enoyl-CoA hydratase/carnithine racemase
MKTRVAAAPAQRISSEQAAGFVASGMWLDYGVALCQPDVFDKALAARADTLKNVKIRSCLSMKPRAVLESDTDGKHFFLFSWHFSGYDRRQHDAGRCNYMPLNLGEVPDYYRRFLDPVDIVIIKTCPMDENGHFNFSAANLWHRAAIERAKLVVVEVTGGLPYVYGKQNSVHVSEVDYIIEGDHQPAVELPNPPPTEIDRAVARQIAAEIEDGACLQIGIGGMPNAVCTLLLESGVRDLGVHTEMLTDGIAELYKTGRVTGTRKTLDPGKIVYTFALGSSALYSATHRNPDFLCYPVDYTNSPHIIMRNDRVISINNTTQIDLQGQVASESDGHRHISGTGGQLQFVRGAYASTEGKSFICLASTYDKRGERRSRIVLNLTPGNVVTTPRSDVMYIVTEYGMVNLKGKSVAERATALIALAHPDFRESLERQAYEYRLIPREVSFTKPASRQCHQPDLIQATAMKYDDPTAGKAVIREDCNGVVTLRLHRPAQLNALSESMLASLQREVDALVGDSSVRCIVISGAGRAFCAGHDLSEMRNHKDLAYYQALFARCSEIMQSIRALSVPVIARVHGIATAAGCQLVGACDLAIASDTARFAVSGINVGLFCATPSVALSRNVSSKRAFDMLVTGRFIDAATAVDWGLINEAVPETELDAAIGRKTSAIVSKSPAAIRYGKAMFYQQQSMALSGAYEYAGGIMARNMMEDDASEGIDAFIGKRPPVWASPVS